MLFFAIYWEIYPIYIVFYMFFLQNNLYKKNLSKTIDKILRNMIVNRYFLPPFQ